VIFGAASFELELRRHAGELRIDADALVARWRARVERSVDAGRTQKWAHQEAFDHVSHDAKKRRAVIDRVRSKRR